MSDLISRQTAIDAIDNALDIDGFRSGLLTRHSAKSAIKSVPPVTPELATNLQPTCNDAISRQAAIDAAALSAAEWDGMYVQDINGRIRKALEKLPSAQPEAPCYLGSPCEYQNPNAEIQEECKLDGTTAVAKSKRTFVELLVHYPHPDVCTYPEYKGKPYYSIKYIEDGECFVGFGTYNPEVLSQYLRDYFMPPVQLEERTEKRTESHGVCLDAISRQAAIRWVKTECNPYGKPTLDFESGKRVMKHLEQMPPAQPEQKWIPCSKRLPRQGQEVICQCRANIIKVLKLDAYGDWYQDAEHCYMGGFVIAWMSLPELYKEGETT